MNDTHELTTYQELPEELFCKCKNGRPCAGTRFEIEEWHREELHHAKEEERKKCRQIFIDEVDWAEWGIDSDQAGEKFDEAREALGSKGNDHDNT